MSAPLKTVGGRQSARQVESGRIQYQTFSWWTMRSAVDHEAPRIRNSKGGWRAIWLASKP